MIEAALAATKTKDCYLAAQYQRRRGRRGHSSSRAITAVGHSFLTIAWHMLTNGELYCELGGHYCTRQNPEKTTRRLVRQPEPLGHVTLEPREVAA